MSIEGAPHHFSTPITPPNPANNSDLSWLPAALLKNFENISEEDADFYKKVALGGIGIMITAVCITKFLFPNHIYGVEEINSAKERIQGLEKNSEKFCEFIKLIEHAGIKTQDDTDEAINSALLSVFNDALPENMHGPIKHAIFEARPVEDAYTRDFDYGGNKLNENPKSDLVKRACKQILAERPSQKLVEMKRAFNRARGRDLDQIKILRSMIEIKPHSCDDLSQEEIENAVREYKAKLPSHLIDIFHHQLWIAYDSVNNLDSSAKFEESPCSKEVKRVLTIPSYAFEIALEIIGNPRWAPNAKVQVLLDLILTKPNPLEPEVDPLDIQKDIIVAFNLLDHEIKDAIKAQANSLSIYPYPQYSDFEEGFSWAPNLIKSAVEQWLQQN